MAIFQGPLGSDQTSALSGTQLDAQHLNSLVVAQASYLQSGSAPSSATATNPPIVTQPSIIYVINSGVAVSWHSVLTTPITLPTAAVAQDVYCDVDDNENYTLTAGAVNFTPPAPAANALRIWKVTTGTSNVGVATYSDQANRSPLGATSFMAQDGSNASAVIFPTTLEVNGQTTLDAGMVVSGGIMRFVNQPPAILTKGSGLSAATSISLGNGGSQNGQILIQVLTSNSIPANPICKITLAATAFTPIGVLPFGSPAILCYADTPVLAAGVWSFNIFSTTALTTAQSVYTISYEVLYQ